MGGGVNSILTVVPSSRRLGSKLPSKTVAYFMAFRGDPKSEDSARFIIHLRSRLNIDSRERSFDEPTRECAPFLFVPRSDFLLDSQIFTGTVISPLYTRVVRKKERKTTFSTIREENARGGWNLTFGEEGSMKNIWFRVELFFFFHEQDQARQTSTWQRTRRG